MPRESFGQNFYEKEITPNPGQKRKEVPGSKARAWTEEPSEEADTKNFDELYAKAARHYEEALGVPPPEDWTTEQITEVMDKKILKDQRELKMLGISDKRAPVYEGKIDATDKTIHRGHRHGEKPRKPGREAKRKELRKEAA